MFFLVCENVDAGPPTGFRGARRKAEGGAVEQWESGAVPEAVVNHSVF
ncbi:hypothetical protein [Leptospira gomenensis]|nr:hypothetical protein [Leptospira gomenensis]